MERTSHLPIVALAIVCFASGCLAIDRFDRFSFGDAGASDSGGGADLHLLSPFGAGCGAQADCQQYPPSPRMVGCLTSYMSVAFPGGMCSRGCTAVGDCTDYAGVGLGAACGVVVVGQQPLCLPICVNASTCRSGYMCCNRGLPGGLNVCAPPTSELCR